MKKELSVVLPTYNEAQRLKGTLLEILDYLRLRGYQFEIIIVDDGSTDATVPIASSLQKENSEIQVIKRGSNSGKGRAVKEGIEKAGYSYCLFMDADNSTSIREWDQFENFFEKGYQVAIGSRHLPGSRVVYPQPWLRRFLGTGYRFLCRHLLGLGLSDINCGFKAYETSLAKRIYAHVQAKDWTFDAEVFCLLKQDRIQSAEVPIHWEHREKKAKTPAIKTVWDTLRNLLEIRKRYPPTGRKASFPKGRLREKRWFSHLEIKSPTGTKNIDIITRQKRGIGR